MANERELEAMQQAVSQISGMNEELMRDLEHQNAQHKAEVSVLNAKHDEKWKEVSGNEAELATLQASLREATDRAEAAEERARESVAAGQSAELAKARAELEEQRSTCEDLRARATSAEEAMKAAALANERELEAMQQAVSQISGMNEELMRDLERQNAKHKAEVAALRSRVEGAEAKGARHVAEAYAEREAARASVG